MSTTACILLLSLGAWSPAFYGRVPAETPTYRITFPDGAPGEVAFFTRTDFVAYEDFSDTALNANCILDRPWDATAAQGPPLTLIRQNITPRAEPKQQREIRLKRGWTDAGYIFVDTPAGDHPVLEKEQKLAQRAAAMAETVEAELAAKNAVQPARAPTAPETLGFWKLWGPHLAILVVGLSLTTLVVKSLVLE